MAYSEFTLESVLPAFQLQKIDTVGFFSQVEVVPPSDHLTNGTGKKSGISYCHRHRESSIRNDCR